jgi:hypothetical protein
MRPRDYEPLDGRLLAIKIVFSLLIVVTALAVVSDALELTLLSRVLSGEDVSDAKLTASDDRQALAGLLQVLVLIAAVIVFIRWFHAAYKNVDVVAWGTRRFGHGWAIGGWFVPFLNLWRPKELINDIHRSGAGPNRTTLLAFWWGVFLISNWIANLAARLAFSGDSLEELRNSSIATLVSDFLGIPGAVLAILVAIALTRGLDARAASLPDPDPDPETDPEQNRGEVVPAAN